MGVRFLHTADIHLGSPLNGLGAENDELRAQLTEATYEAFRRLVTIAIDEAVEFVVIAGDLYDRESRSVRANQFAVAQFQRLDDANIPVYLSYGNHDPVEAGIEYVELPANVHEFSATEPESVIHETDGDATACLCGQSYRRKTEAEKLHLDFEPADPGLPTIGLLHTGLELDSNPYVPCSSAELAGREGFDYWALGHIHQPRIHNRDPVVAYPGIPQGRHVNEAGLRGAFLAELAPDGRTELEFVPTGQVIWQEETVSIETDDEDPPTQVPEIRGLLEEQIDEIAIPDSPRGIDVPVRTDNWSPSGVMCRWILTGRGPAHETLASDEDVIDILRNDLRSEYDRRSPFVWAADVRDRTGSQLPPLEELRDDPVFERFEQLVAEVQASDEIREDLVDSMMGSVIEWDDGSEEEQPTRFRIRESDMDRMITGAADLVADELRKRRLE